MTRIRYEMVRGKKEGRGGHCIRRQGGESSISAFNHDSSGVKEGGREGGSEGGREQSNILTYDAGYTVRCIVSIVWIRGSQHGSMVPLGLWIHFGKGGGGRVGQQFSSVT